MTKINEFTFPSTDGKTQLHGMEWVPADRQPVAVLQIAHGVSEHIARYDDFARFLNEQGFAVVGHDHLGHGRSAPHVGAPIYFGGGNTWETVVNDIRDLHLRIRSRYPGLPVFLLGHSMGSFLARTYLIRYPGSVQGAVIMGTGWQPAAALAGGLAVSAFLSRRRGADSTDKLVTRLAFGAYNNAFAPTRTPYDWLSADTASVDRYIADPACGQDATVGLFYEMLRGIRFNQKAKNLRRMDPHTPILLISGAMDPVGNMSTGVRQTYDAFRRAGVTDVALRLYPELRHEILNEASQQQAVYRDVCDWLASHLPK